MVPALTATSMLRDRARRPQLAVLLTLWGPVVLLALFAGRFWISAYHRTLVGINMALVVATYAVLLVVAAALAEVVETLNGRTPPGPTGAPIATAVRRWFGLLSWAALLVQAIYTAAFLLSPVNLLSRVVEEAFLIGALASYLRFAMIARRHPNGVVWTARVDLIERVLVASAITTLVALLLRQTGVVPPWVDLSLVYPALVVVLALPVTRMLRAVLDSASTDGPATSPLNASSDLEFFERMARELGLSAREVEVLKLVMVGMPTRDMARKLAVSEKTVRNHVSALYRKTETRNRVELVRVFEPA